MLGLPQIRLIILFLLLEKAVANLDLRGPGC